MLPGQQLRTMACTEAGVGRGFWRRSLIRCVAALRLSINLVAKLNMMGRRLRIGPSYFPTDAFSEKCFDASA